MINLNDQIDRIVSEQFKNVQTSLKDIPEGDQKEFIKSTMKQIQETRTGDPMQFVEQFSKIKGEEVDIEKLKELIKNHNNGH